MRSGLRMSKNTIISFCLVVGSFWAFLMLNHFINQAVVKKPSHRSADRKSKGQDERVAFWHKKPRSGIPPATTFITTPFSADNKRPLTEKVEVDRPKIISWQAGRTQRVLSTTSDMFAQCPVSACEVSPSTKSLLHADAVVFDQGRMNKQTPPPPSSKRVTILYDMRAGPDVFFKAKGDMFSKYWKSAINWVWSFKPNSDIFEPFAYLARSSKTVKMRSIAESAKEKSRLVLWLDPRVDRQDDGLDDLDKNLHRGPSLSGVEDYLKELKHQVPYDTMSMLDLQAMLNNSKSRHGAPLSRYHFILAFEWITCRQYVTDLLFYAFHPRVQAVPVVRGGFNYTKHLPPGSFVDASAFPTARELGRHLKKLAEDNKAYSEMLWKKSQLVREDATQHAWCQLCYMLHRASRDKKLMRRYEDIHSWTRKSTRCQSPNETTTDSA